MPAPDRRWLRLPPPLLFALPLVAGLVLHARAPLVRPAGAVAAGLRALAVALVAAGAAHLLTSAALFRRARTTVLPHRRSSALVTRGAYRWTRNPMYVGMTLVYLGAAAWTGALWAVLLLPLPLLILDRRTIPAEEQALEEALGADYAAYKRRVRRWL